MIFIKPTLSMDYTIQKGKTIILKSLSRVQQIYVENILYISCDANLLSIYLVDQDRPVFVSKTLRDIELELQEFRFVRINRNELINLRYFKSYTINGKRKINLYSDKTLIVSRRRWATIKDYF